MLVVGKVVCGRDEGREGRSAGPDLLSLEEKPKRDLQLSVRAEKLRPDDDKVED